MMMVSVICPTYNQGRYLRQGLDSILAQQVDFTYEVLIGEDCSPDNTNEILAEYEKKYPEIFSVFHREKNLKQSANIYDLFMHAKGKYVITLDLDDYFTDVKKLQKQVDFLEANPQYIGTAHNFWVVDQEGNKRQENPKGIDEKYLNKGFSVRDMEERIFVYQTGTLMYHNIWKEDKDYSILYRSDDTVVDLTINSMLLLRKDIFIMEECMSAYRLVISTSQEATNARSVGQKNLALDFYKSCRQISMLHRYFDRRIDYSGMWSNLILSYLKNMFKKQDPRYHMGQWLGMFVKSSLKTKKRVLGYLIGSMGRSLKRG